MSEINQDATDLLKPRPSKVGKVSLYLGIFNCVALFCVLTLLTIGVVSPAEILFTLLMFSIGISIIMAIVCFCQFNVKKKDAIWGLILSVLVLLFIVFLYWIGRNNILL